MSKSFVAKTSLAFMEIHVMMLADEILPASLLVFFRLRSSQKWKDQPTLISNLEIVFALPRH